MPGAVVRWLVERVMTHGLPAANVRVVSEPARRVAVVREVADGPQDIGRVTSAAVARLVGGPARGRLMRRFAWWGCFRWTWERW